MDNKRKVHIFAHSDLDGASCCLLLEWYLWNLPSYTLTNHENLHTNVAKWFLKNKAEDYDIIFFFGLDTCTILNLVDLPNVRIFDHHQEAKRCKELYKSAKVEIIELGSTVLGLYRYFKEKMSERKITTEQRKFVALVDDYISYRLLEKNFSIGLNMLYWNYQGDKVQKLKNDFGKGFNTFNENQLKIIDFYKNKIQRIIDKSDFYVGDFKIQGVFRKVIATFADTCINEVAAQLTDMGFEVAMVVNIETKKVSLRKNHHSNIDLSKMAKLLCDGGGYKNTAGGILTEKFLNFTKMLETYDIGKRT